VSEMINSDTAGLSKNEAAAVLMALRLRHVDRRVQKTPRPVREFWKLTKQNREAG